MMTDLQSQSPFARASNEPSDLTGVLSVLRGILDQRNQTNVVVQAREEQSAEYFSRKRSNEQRDGARREWATRRIDLEERISKVRRERIQKDVEEVTQDVKSANRSRWVRTVVGTAVLIFGCARMFWNGYYSVASLKRLFVMDTARAASYLSLLLIPLLFFVYDWFLSGRRKQLVTPPTSLDDIERAAVQSAGVIRWAAEQSALVIPYVFDPLVRLALYCDRVKRDSRGFWAFKTGASIFISHHLYAGRSAVSWNP